MKTLRLDLGERSYPIYIGSDLLKNSALIKPHVNGKQVLIVSNDVVAPIYLDQVKQLFAQFEVHCFILPDGESYKTMQSIEKIIDELMRLQLDRKVTLVALGGGVIGDMVGFAAAIYLRGVNFIQIPTTLLAQVDSSVGGKTGINHPLGKNMVGAFYQPKCVIADTKTLNTLDDRQLSCGLAEVFKYALINDADFLRWCEDNLTELLNRTGESLSYAIETSCRAKADIVAQDEKESGIRALLNLGHTFGHAIENGLGYGNCLHGEAVAIGMLMAAELSMHERKIEEGFVERIKVLLERAKLPINIPGSLTKEQILKLMQGDKKVQDGVLRLVLFEDECQCVISSEYSHKMLQQTIESFLSRV